MQAPPWVSMSLGGTAGLRGPSVAGQPCLDRGLGLLRSLAWELAVLGCVGRTHLMGSSRERL